LSSISKNTFKTLFRQVIGVLIQLFSVVIIARNLGVEGNGLYGIAILLPTFMSLLFSFGLNSSNIYLIGKKQYSLTTVYSSVILISIIIILIAMFCGFFSIYFFNTSLFPNVDFDILLIALCIFPFSFFYLLHLSFLQAIEDFSSYNIVSLVRPILFFCVILLLYYFKYLTLRNVILLSFVNSLISSFIATYFVYRKNFNFKIKAISKKYIIHALTYGFKSHITNLVAFINYRADMFLLNIFSTPIDVGIYYIGIQIVERMWILSSSMSTVLFPRFVKLQNDSKTRVLLITKAFRIVFLLTLLISILLIITGYYLIELIFGKQYIDSYVAIIILIPGVVFGAGSRILANSIAAKGKPELNMYTSLIAMVLNIFLNILFIPIYGFLGAALATSISYSLNLGLRIWLIKRIEPFFYLKDLFITKKDFCFIYNKSLGFINNRV